MEKLSLFALLHFLSVVASFWICGADFSTEVVEFCRLDRRTGESKCFRCEDFNSSCFTLAHEYNCTAWSKDELERNIRDELERNIRGRNCSKPPEINNGTHNGSHLTTFPQGQNITYVCDEGYFMSGSNNSQCGDFGQWTNHPNCEEITCPVESPWHWSLYNSSYGGKRKDYGYLRSGESVTFSCDDGYMLLDHGTRTCTRHGHLNNHIPVCVSLDIIIVITSVPGGLLVWALITSICMFRMYRQSRTKNYKGYDLVFQLQNLAHDKQDQKAGDSGIATPASSSTTLSQPSTNEETPGKNVHKSANRRPDVQNTNSAIVNVIVSVGANEGAVGSKPQPDNQNTERKEANDESAKPLLPRSESTTAVSQQPRDDDTGEKAIGVEPRSLSFAGQTLSDHRQEEELGKPKFGLSSGEVDKQDLGL